MTRESYELFYKTAYIHRSHLNLCYYKKSGIESVLSATGRMENKEK
jgi:hypothetical protein